MIINPPSTIAVLPVIYAEASLARNKATFAISSGTPIRRSGSIEILTGTKAGKTFWDEVNSTLRFEEDSIYFKVNERLEQMTKTLKILK